MFWLFPWDEDAQSRSLPWATYSLIALNVLAFVAMFMGTPAETAAWYRNFGLVADHHAWWQYLSSDFVHGGLMHLAGNMLFLVVFGDNVEDIFGPIVFLLLYFLGGLAGDVYFVAANPALDIPSFGASGCISAIAGAYGVMFLANKIGVRLMFLVFTLKTFEVRAFWVVLFWFGADVFQTVATHGVMPASGGVNYVAHGIGVGFGVLVGILAWLFGVGHRYRVLDRGSAWLGYWPPGLESTRARTYGKGIERKPLL